MTNHAIHAEKNLGITIGLCFLVALMEGVDLQAPGIAARGMAAAFALDKQQLGLVFSVGVMGLLPGAYFGGLLADRIGRKWVLTASVALFGAFSIATALAWDMGSLMVARLLTGLGLGGALPNLIALASECAGEKHKKLAVSLMYCGVPMGAGLGAALALTGVSSSWTLLFYVGGVLPLMIAPAIAWLMPESAQFRATGGSAGERIGVIKGLFGTGMATTTLLLWMSYFFTLMVVYILINWLPSLIVDQGFSGRDASWVIVSLQSGATIGTLLLGLWAMKLPSWAIATLIYSGILISLAALGTANSLNTMMLAGAMAGFFSVGGQGVLYGLAPPCYPTRVRATGVGSAIAVGRLGAMTGPMVAGQMLAMGAGTTGVMGAAAPGILIAALAMFWLANRAPALPLPKVEAV